MYLFNKQLLSTYYVLDMVQALGIQKEQKRQNLCPHKAHIIMLITNKMDCEQLKG